jgi:hypothetical protein
MTCHVSLSYASQTLRLDGATAAELKSSQLLDVVRACPTLEQLALLGLRRISKKDLSEAITQLPALQVVTSACFCTYTATMHMRMPEERVCWHG